MLTAFVVTLLAGLATTAGGALALHPRWRSQHMQSIALALAGGAMLAVSVGEMLPEAWRESAGPHQWGDTLVAFGIGLAIAVGLAQLVPRLQQRFREPVADNRHQAMARTALVAGAVIFAHNLPEGMATFQATLHDPSFGIGLAIAIALHNLPEGMAVAAPLYLATGNWRKALLWATLSGLAEPLGGVVGHLLFAGTSVSTGGLLAALAAMMLSISFFELLPTAARIGGWRRCVLGAAIGVVMMAATLVILN